jgi:peptide/nickel transport system ATP-binding protein
MLAENLNNQFESLVEIEDLHVHFRVSYEAGIAGARGERYVKAVNGVSIKVQRGEILSLVGESGSGKTTLGRAVVGLARPTSGRILLDGRQIDLLSKKALKELWRTTQMIFQDPYSTFNPLASILDSLTIPVRKFGLSSSPSETRKRVEDALKQVGLDYADLEGKYPTQLSGGQRQRVAIARALIVEPKVIIADEPVSMLDVSLRAGILDLINDLNRKFGVTVVFITHDLAVAEYISDRIAVMYKGKIVELAPSSELIESPFHPYTELLLQSVPRLMGEQSWSETQETPVRQVDWTFEGCEFYAKCPIGKDMCVPRAPQLLEATRGRYVACYVRSETTK